MVPVNRELVVVTIEVNPTNEAPNSLTNTPGPLKNGDPSGTTVATLAATDPDLPAQTLTYSLPAGADNASFTITGNTIKTNFVAAYATKSSYSINARVSDGTLTRDLAITGTIPASTRTDRPGLEGLRQNQPASTRPVRARRCGALASSVGRTPMKSGRTQVEIIALYGELGSYRAVAAVVGCDHKTVKRYVDAAGDAGLLAPVLTRARVTDDVCKVVAERVEQTHAKVTARRRLSAVDLGAGRVDAV